MKDKDEVMSEEQIAEDKQIADNMREYWKCKADGAD